MRYLAVDVTRAEITLTQVLLASQVYSIGDNLRDDGATPTDTTNNSPNGDIVLNWEQ